jgi:hypothetical protein
MSEDTPDYGPVADPQSDLAPSSIFHMLPLPRVEVLPMSRLDWHAATAPVEVPFWFEREEYNEPEWDAAATMYFALKLLDPDRSRFPCSREDAMLAALRKGDVGLVHEGFELGLFQTILREREEFQKGKDKRALAYAERRFFTWRRYYADKMVQMLSSPIFSTDTEIKAGGTD